MTRPPSARVPFSLRVHTVAVVVGAAIVSLTNCTREGDAASEPLTYSGSSTMAEKILPGLIAGYERTGGKEFGAVSMAGSTPGFKAVMAGKVSVAGVGRSLTSAEKEERPYYEIIGYDAVAIFVHAQNPVSSLSLQQVKDIFTGKVVQWKDVGGPDLPIEAVREFDDGRRATLQMFKEAVLEPAAFGPATQVDLPSECVRYTSQKPGAITFASLSFASQGVKALRVDGIEATDGTVRSGAYAIARPLLLVSKTFPHGELKKFFDYASSPQGQAEIGKLFIARHKGN